jgi:RNA polymerase-binding transcription factor DksA
VATRKKTTTKKKKTATKRASGTKSASRSATSTKKKRSKTSTRKAVTAKAGASRAKKTAKTAKTSPRKSSAKKTASTKAAAGRTAAATSKKKKAPSRRRAGGSRSSARQSGHSVAEAAATAAPDAKGYVFINGRRVRMISTKGLAARKKSRSAAAAAAAQEAKAETHQPVKSKLNRRDLERFRNLLLIKRAELVGDLSAMEAEALQSDGGNISHMPIHMADIGTDTYDQDFMLGMAETERQRLREIDAALGRIEDGTYGVCQMTGKPIPKARLNAKPWAKYTVEAARELERGWTA